MCHVLMCSVTTGYHFAGLVFEGIGFFDVGVAVFLGNYTKLSKCMVSCSSTKPPLADSNIVSMLKARLKPVQPVQSNAG